MSSLRGKNEGLFNPALRFAFTNITDEDFVSAWGGSPVVVKPHQSIEVPHHLADKFTDELVDKIMTTQVKMAEVTYYEEHPGTLPNSFRAPSSLGVPAARKVWEDKIVRQLEVDEESPEIQLMRAQIKEELIADMSAETSREPVHIPTSPVGSFGPDSLKEFAQIKSGNDSAPAPAKKPLRVKKIKVD